MPDRVETTDPEGADFTWVMQTTFVVTILAGAPIVALASVPATLPTWGARVSFAIRVGAIVWLVVAIGAFLYARREADEERSDLDPEAGEGGSRDDQGDRKNRNDSDDTEDSDSATTTGTHSPSSERSSET